MFWWKLQFWLLEGECDECMDGKNIPFPDILDNEDVTYKEWRQNNHKCLAKELGAYDYSVSTLYLTLKNVKLVNWRKSCWRVSITIRNMLESKEWCMQFWRKTNLTQIACYCRLILKWHIAVNIKMKISLPCGHVDLWTFLQVLPTMQRERKSLFSLY